MIEEEGPYPPLIQPPDGGYWIQNGDYEVAKGEDGVWRAPEISTEHYTLQVDKTAAVYGNYFKKQVREGERGERERAAEKLRFWPGVNAPNFYT